MNNPYEKIINVIIITLKRPTLKTVTQRIKKIIPNSNIILITEKGELGTLRNKGLIQSKTEYTAFIDDDVLITKEWYEQSIKHLENSNVIGYTVYLSGFTMICKTKQLKEIGGFPTFDSNITHKKGIKTTINNYGLIHYETETAMFKHGLKWIMAGFDNIYPFGHNNGITTSLKQTVTNLWKKPLLSSIYFLWFIKAIYIKILNEMFYRNSISNIHKP